MPEDYSLSDIHDRDFESVVERLTNEDTERLLARKAQFTESPCPVCFETRLDLAFESQGFKYKRCQGCDLLLLSPAPTEEQQTEYIAGSEALRYWREKMPARVKSSRERMYLGRADFVLDAARRHGVPLRAILEIGAGNGEFAEAIVRQSPTPIESIVLVEPQPLHLDLPNVRVVSSVMREWRGEERFDAVILFEVLEHILDPNPLLEAIFQRLAPGGLFILSTPNERSFETGLLKGLSSNLLYDHVRLYGPGSLETLLRKHGFEVLEIETPGQLDVEMVHRQFELGRLDLSGQPPIQFLMEEGYAHRAEFQAFLRKHRLSSHMRGVARRGRPGQ